MIKVILSVFIFISICKIGYAQSAEELYNKGNYFIKTGNMDSAMTCFNESIMKDTTYYKSYHGRGIVKLATKKYAEAIQDFNTTIRQKFNYADAFFARGVAYLAVNNRKKACQDFEQAMNFGMQEAKDMMQQYCQ